MTGVVPEHLVVRTKLVPPRLRRDLVPRERLAGILAEVARHAITIVRADAGFGKTTVAASLASAHQPVAWYTLTEEDADPFLFLAHLTASLQLCGVADGAAASAYLNGEGGAAKHWATIIDLLMNDALDHAREDVLLVLDDYHLVDCPAIAAIVDRLISRMPGSVHVVLVTRHSPTSARLARLRANGEVLEIGRAELAFDAEEARQLFDRRHGLSLTDEQASLLISRTEGWPIGLQLLGQRAHATGDLSAILEVSNWPSGVLFDFLATEVFAAQPERLRQFMLDTAVLRRIEAEVCDQLLGRHDSHDLLRELEERSLFVVALGNEHATGYRYHHLFQDFLATRAQETDPQRWRRLHRKASQLYEAAGDAEAAVHHACASGSPVRASALLDRLSGDLIAMGRYDALAGWLESLPEPLMRERPNLLCSLGDAMRLTSRFDRALEAYDRARTRYSSAGSTAGEARALEGAALVYLDTVQPSRAEPLLQRALALAGADEERISRISWLIAENAANRGDLDQAELMQRAIAGSADAAALDPRILVRQGRFAEARAMVNVSLIREPAGNAGRVPRSHRESAVVLAWIDAFTGDAERARSHAEEALRLGRDLRSPIVETVALARLGHGWLTGDDADPDRADAYYRASAARAQQLAVPRFAVESLLGQVVVCGRTGRIGDAYERALEALAILEDAGDRYLASVVWLALGAAAVLCEHPEATAWLARAGELAQQCGDRHGPVLAALWQAERGRRTHDKAAFEQEMALALREAGANGYEFLFTRQPFLGLPDREQQRALLGAAVRNGVEVDRARRLTAESGGSRIPLYVRTFGTFAVWRDGHEVPRSAWGREKAVQLFQYLLERRGRPTLREQISDELWPDAPRGAAAGGLRVALNALQRALEPDRATCEEPTYVRRLGAALMLAPDLIRTDADDFSDEVRQAGELEAAGELAAALAVYRTALDRCSGEYLEDQPYAGWATDSRDRLRTAYLATSGHFGELLLGRRDFEEAIQVAQRMIARDRCLEQAYAILMRAYSATSRPALALREYERCARSLQHELGVRPSPQFRQLRAWMSSTP